MVCTSAMLSRSSIVDILQNSIQQYTRESRENYDYKFHVIKKLADVL